MAIQYANGRITTDGLVLSLNAADRNSYPGSGATWTDTSGQGNNVTLYNSPTFSSNNGGYLIFDGANNSGLASNTNILNSSAYTKVAWFYTVAASANIISGGNDGQHAFWLGGFDYLQAGHNGSWATVSYSSVSTINKWNFGAVTFNTSTGWVLYYNGVSVNTNSSTATFNGSGDISIARYGTGNLFNGYIATALVYNRVLSADEILQNYNATKSRFGLK